MTSPDGPIVVTGATGNVGLDVARNLMAMGAPVRIAARDPATTREALPAAEVRRFEFGDEGSYAATFAGSRSLFLLRPPRITAVKTQIVPAIDAARAAGVRHLVPLSLQGSDRIPGVPHRRSEDELTGSEALSNDEIAGILSGVPGREIRYTNPPAWSFWRHMRRRGTAPGYVLVMIALYTACRLGLTQRVTRDTERLRDRAPRTFREFAAEHAEAWASPQRASS